MRLARARQLRVAAGRTVRYFFLLASLVVLPPVTPPPSPLANLGPVLVLLSRKGIAARASTLAVTR